MRTGSPSDKLTEIIDPIEYPDWNEAVSSATGHSFFHTSNWAAVLKESYSYRPVYFTRIEGPALSALVPVMEVDSPFTGKRGVALPFTDLCEPFATDRDRFPAILDEVFEYGKKAGWKYLELRGGAGYMGETPPSRLYLRHVLDLHEGESALFNRIEAANRRNIRKAAKSGVRVVISDSERELDSYYRLHCLTRKRHGLPPQPPVFFRAIYRNVISKGMGFTALGIHEGRAIAGAVFFHSGPKAVFKYGASDIEDQRFRANNLVMWEAIRRFSKKGFKELCFGRTDPEHAGLARFKRGWGTREEMLSYYRYDLRRSMFVRDPSRLGGPAGRILSRLPVPVLRLAGALLYRHMG